MMNRLQKILSTVLVLLASSTFAQTKVAIPNNGASIDGYWYPSGTPSSPQAPSIVALHGCGGMMQGKDKPNARTVGYAKLLNNRGWHVLFVDSLSSRGVKSVCGGKNEVTQAQRVTDVQAAVAYLAARSNVDAKRIGVLGFSHGGTSTLLSNDARVTYANAPRAFVAFYPGCGETSSRQMQWQPARPVLMQLGAADDWTSPLPCQSLAALHPNLVTQDTYADAHHGFDADGTVPRAVQLDTPKGMKIVHTGGNPAAKEAAQAKLVAFFKEHFK
jgi:dienelactone hydrolase